MCLYHAFMIVFLHDLIRGILPITTIQGAALSDCPRVTAEDVLRYAKIAGLIILLAWFTLSNPLAALASAPAQSFTSPIRPQSAVIPEQRIEVESQEVVAAPSIVNNEPEALDLSSLPISKEATIIPSLLSVREGPGKEYREIATLSSRERVDILTEKDGWYKIKFNQGEGWIKGWVNDNFVLPPEFLWAQPEPHDQVTTCDPCWVSNETYYARLPQHIIGKAVMYAPGLMEATAEFNGLDLSGFRGGVATSSAAMIGQVVWLRVLDQEWEGPYLVVDVSGRPDVWLHVVDRGTVIEVDFPTAVEWGMATGNFSSWEMISGALADVEVWSGLLPPDLSVSPSDAIFYKDYFQQIVTFAPEGTVKQWTPAYAQFVNFDEYKAVLEQYGIWGDYLAISSTSD